MRRPPMASSNEGIEKEGEKKEESNENIQSINLNDGRSGSFFFLFP